VYFLQKSNFFIALSKSLLLLLNQEDSHKHLNHNQFQLLMQMLENSEWTLQSQLSFQQAKAQMPAWWCPALNHSSHNLLSLKLHLLCQLRALTKVGSILSKTKATSRTSTVVIRDIITNMIATATRDIITNLHHINQWTTRLRSITITKRSLSHNSRQTTMTAPSTRRENTIPQHKSQLLTVGMHLKE